MQSGVNWISRLKFQKVIKLTQNTHNVPKTLEHRRYNLIRSMPKTNHLTMVFCVQK